ncbi:YcgN family cysteine cluster protein [Aliidiomarina taiwanensis]|uniref:YcgN family cysteine cluster protein n=1 Tax=Aliidiomarina taiwanensis TaxID=946228 RepID=A0A432X1Y5_9GAMM|nr:YcgN family cysteine cluster protein [Aliidiomarina taiwanensis]RUO40570.1 YcgN family cysteine cluster protein [Aliidiomarina taiwanensis]
MSISPDFWQQKSLQQMSQEEWELLCDGCGKCCLHKVLEAREDVPDDAPMGPDDTMHFVNVACRLLDTQTSQCRHYENRLDHVPECVVLTPEKIDEVHYMPPSCAYRRLAEGKPLPSWHPLRHDGSRAAMVAAGMATTGYTLYSDADELDEDDLLIIRWPLHTAP